MRGENFIPDLNYAQSETQREVDKENGRPKLEQTEIFKVQIE